MLTEVLEIARNCSQTAALYNSLSLGTADSLSLLRALLPPSFNTTDVVLEEQLRNTTFVKYVISSAGRQCTSQICVSLNFPGNADIAGIGSIIAYGTIAFLATYLMVASWLDHYIAKRFRVKSSTVGDFFQSLIYFQFMAQIATWVYLSRMKTMYELSIALLFTRLVSCATSVSFFSTDVNNFPGIWNAIWALGMLGSVATGIFSFCASWYGAHVFLIDAPCHIAYNLPLRLVQVSASIHLLCLFGILTMILIPYISDHLSRRILQWLSWKLPSRSRTYDVADLYSSAFLAAEMIVLWTSFSLILVVRWRAEGIFGISYQDNAMGFGQILSIGFCLQTTVQIVVDIIKGPRANSKEGSERDLSANASTPAILPPTLDTSRPMGNSDEPPKDQNSGTEALSEPPLSPQRSRTSNMESGLSPTNSQTSILLHSMPQQGNATSREIEPNRTTLQKRPTFS